MDWTPCPECRTGWTTRALGFPSWVWQRSCAGEGGGPERARGDLPLPAPGARAHTPAHSHAATPDHAHSQSHTYTHTLAITRTQSLTVTHIHTHTLPIPPSLQAARGRPVAGIEAAAAFPRPQRAALPRPQAAPTSGQGGGRPALPLAARGGCGHSWSQPQGAAPRPPALRPAAT